MNNYSYNSPYNLSFGSAIRFSKIAYVKNSMSKLFNSENDITYPWRIEQSKYLKLGHSEDASYCTMGVIKNSSGGGFMFHLRPGATRYDIIREHLKRAVANLTSNSENKLTGLLIGGSCENKGSVELYQQLQSMYKELNVKFSAFLGQTENKYLSSEPPHCNILFDGIKDEYIICPFAKRNHKEQLNSLSDLHNYFKTVIIRKGEDVKFD